MRTVSTGNNTTSALRAPPGAPRTQELRSSLGQDHSGFHLHPGADPVTQLSIPRYYWERAVLPGVLTHRLTGGTSHNQRQQDQLTPEITRC